MRHLAPAIAGGTTVSSFCCWDEGDEGDAPAPGDGADDVVEAVDAEVAEAEGATAAAAAAAATAGADDEDDEVAADALDSEAEGPADCGHEHERTTEPPAPPADGVMYNEAVVAVLVVALLLFLPDVDIAP